MTSREGEGTAAAGPLRGIRVLDLSRVLAGPFCSMILGDLGADVIKVERPGGGDDTREWGPPFAGGESAYYLAVNRNKKSVALDLASEEGAATARALAARNMIVAMDHPTAGTVRLIGSPMKLSVTPVEYRLPPPLLGEHTASAPGDWLDGEAGPDGAPSRREGEPSGP